MERAATLVAADDIAGATTCVGHALASAPPGNVGWLIPIDPLLGVQNARDARNDVLTQLRGRAV